MKRAVFLFFCFFAKSHITTKWDQARPYWNECPEFVDEVDGEQVSEFAYTGCVATAMSQIMFFHKYPEQTSEPTAPYDFTYGDGLGNYGTAHVESQPVTTFDWAHMLETYTGAEDEVFTTAVAHLMFYVGVAVKTQYGKGASGAYTDDIPQGLRLLRLWCKAGVPQRLHPAGVGAAGL